MIELNNNLSNMEKMKIEDFGYVVRNGILAFQKGPFSNFWGAFQGQGAQPQISISEGDFNCNEQYYMWQKAKYFKDEETAKKILEAKNPRVQKELGRQVANFREKWWNNVKVEKMTKGLLDKFLFNQELGQLLASTGDLIIAEAADWDLEWGTGYTHLQDECFDQAKWKGKNLLGFALMDTRKILMS